MSSKNYVNKEELETEVIEFQRKLRKTHKIIGKDRKQMQDAEKYGLHLVSKRLCSIIMEMTTKIMSSSRYNNIPYDVKSDIISGVSLEILKVLNSYNKDYFKDNVGKKPNSFGYFTRSIKQCISKLLGKINEKKTKENNIFLLLDDISIDFGNEEDNENFKTSIKTTRDYIDCLEGDDLYYHNKTKENLPKQKLKPENLEQLKSLVLGINQYN